MATKYADMFADLSADATGETLVQDPSDRPSGNAIQRHMKTALIRYTMKGDEGAADIIRLCQLPKGATPIPQKCGIRVLVDLGGTATIDVGDEDTEAPTPLIDSDADRYCDGVDVGATGYDAFANGAAATALYSLRSQCWMTATFATLTTPAEGGVIEFELVYLEPGPETYVVT